MTEKDYKTACRMINYDRIYELRETEHRSIQWIADHVGLNFRPVKKYLEMDRSEFEAFSESITNKPFTVIFCRSADPESKGKAAMDKKSYLRQVPRIDSDTTLFPPERASPQPEYTPSGCYEPKLRELV